MLHEINFIDWQDYQKVQRKRCLLAYVGGLFVMVSFIEAGIFLYWQHKSQLVELVQTDYQVSLAQFEQLKRQQKQGMQTEKLISELRQVESQWRNKKAALYLFIHSLKSAANPSVSIDSLIQKGLKLELTGQYSSLNEFNRFMYQLNQAAMVDDIEVESVSASRRTSLSGARVHLSDFRIQIQLAGDAGAVTKIEEV